MYVFVFTIYTKMSIRDRDFYFRESMDLLQKVLQNYKYVKYYEGIVLGSLPIHPTTILLIKYPDVI